MAYKKGEVEFHKVTDTRTDDYDMSEWFYLPHSCDKWVIGGPKEAQDLIDDLTALLAKPSESIKNSGKEVG